MFSGVTNKLSSWVTPLKHEDTKIDAEPDACSVDVEKCGEEVNDMPAKEEVIEKDVHEEAKTNFDPFSIKELSALKTSLSSFFATKTSPVEEGKEGGTPDSTAVTIGDEAKEEIENSTIPISQYATGLLTTAVGKASGAMEVATDLVNKVGETAIFSEFNKEQAKFIQSKKHEEPGILPWIGYTQEEKLKADILALSEDKRNFVRAPPPGVNFEFEVENYSASAAALLQHDGRLKKLRFDLVPKVISEQNFWRNYFYRVTLLKQSCDLISMTEGEGTTHERTHEGGRDVEVSDEGGPHEIADASVDDLETEFISEHYHASSKDLDEMNRDLKELGMAGKDDAEWEAELQAELQEFEVVEDQDSKLDSKDFQKEVDELNDTN